MFPVLYGFWLAKPKDAVVFWKADKCKHTYIKYSEGPLLP